MTWRNVLFCTHTRPDYMPPPMYASNMVICGPDYPTERLSGGLIKSVKAPLKTPYDVASLIQSLLGNQQPELFIARLDSAMDNIPCNLAAIRAPKLGIFGDSHHMTRPIQSLLQYASHERYDFLILDHNKQHAHWYHEAGLENLVWIPALLLADYLRPPSQHTRREIAFVGQVGSRHPERTRLIESLQARGLPMSVRQMPQHQANRLYNESRIVLNCSLNGDFNLRAFETLAAGGFLLTDRLSPLSGLYQLFSESEDFVHYDGFEDFVEQANRYLDDAQARNRIAHRGHRLLAKRFSLRSRIQTLHRLVRHGKFDEDYSVMSDKRIGSYRSNSREHFEFRVRFYEWVQEQHRLLPAITVVNHSSGDVRLCCDLADLPRLRIFSDTGIDRQGPELVLKCGLDDVIRFGIDEGLERKADNLLVAICDADSAQDFDAVHEASAILLANWIELGTEEKQQWRENSQKRGFDLMQGLEALAIRRDAWAP